MEFGVKGTAGMSDTEMSAQDLLAGYAGGRSPEVSAALASLGEAGQVTNLMDVPEYKALYDTGRAGMNNQLSQLGRTLQISGNTSSGAGADVMASRVGDLNTQLMGSLAPYAAQERERRYQAPIMAASVASLDTQSRLDAVKTYGALPRELEQLSLDAEYMSQYLNETESLNRVQALSAVGGIGNTIIKGGEQQDWAQWASLIGNVASGAMKGGAQGGWGGAIAGGIAGAGDAANQN
jgi:hypothetical protein